MMTMHRWLGGAVSLLVSASVMAYEPAGTPDDWASPVMKPPLNWMVLIDRLEAGRGDGHQSRIWEASAWYGGDINRINFATEGEGERGRTPESAEIEMTYSRLFRPYWEWQAGARHDFHPGSRTHLSFGLSGALPYEIETQAMVYVSDDGDASTRVELEYDLNITQRLKLQSRFELNAAFSDVREVGVGSGLVDTEFGVRLRYELRREIAPYVGLQWERVYGDTRRLARDEGEDASSLQVVAGLRVWF